MAFAQVACAPTPAGFGTSDTVLVRRRVPDMTGHNADRRDQPARYLAEPASWVRTTSATVAFSCCTEYSDGSSSLGLRGTWFRRVGTRRAPLALPWPRIQHSGDTASARHSPDSGFKGIPRRGGSRPVTIDVRSEFLSHGEEEVCDARVEALTGHPRGSALATPAVPVGYQPTAILASARTHSSGRPIASSTIFVTARSSSKPSGLLRSGDSSLSSRK